MDWTSKEDNLLLLCKVAIIIFQFIGRRYQSFGTVRQILHEQCPVQLEICYKNCLIAKLFNLRRNTVVLNHIPQKKKIMYMLSVTFAVWHVQTFNYVINILYTFFFQIGVAFNFILKNFKNSNCKSYFILKHFHSTVPVLIPEINFVSNLSCLFLSMIVLI